MPTVGEGGVVTYEVSCDWRFQPPNTLLKQEGLQLAEASFRDLEETNVDSRYRARKVDRLI